MKSLLIISTIFMTAASYAQENSKPFLFETGKYSGECFVANVKKSDGEADVSRSTYFTKGILEVITKDNVSLSVAIITSGDTKTSSTSRVEVKELGNSKYELTEVGSTNYFYDDNLHADKYESKTVVQMDGNTQINISNTWNGEKREDLVGEQSVMKLNDGRIVLQSYQSGPSIRQKTMHLVGNATCIYKKLK